MLVIFVFDGDRDRVREVIYQKAENLVASRQWFPNGTTKDTVLAADDLVQALEERGGMYSPCHPTEVDDLRSAFKYLGKSADLAETLPDVDLFRAIQPAVEAQ
jgi:hypothetical protein